jgi:Dyp-type peroxidase family
MTWMQRTVTRVLAPVAAMLGWVRSGEGPSTMNDVVGAPTLRLSRKILDDVQGNITPGFRKDFQEFVFLEFLNAKAAKAWITAVRPEITSAFEVASFTHLYRSIRKRSRDGAASPRWEVRRFARSVWVNVAFTAGGLKLIDAERFKAIVGDENAHKEERCQGLDAFVEGLVARYKGKFDYAIDALEQGGRPVLEVQDVELDPPPADGTVVAPPRIAHALLIVAADSEDDLRIETDRQCERLPGLGVAVLARFRGATLGEGREHFGYRDGISQPDPEDPLKGWKLTEDVVAPGEVILGCTEESPAGEQVGETQKPSLPYEWMRYGSFLAFIKIRQHVRTFRDLVVQNSEQAGLKPEQFAAKVIGRWPNGMKVGDPKRPNLAVQEEEPTWKEEDARISHADFANDQDGFRFPLFAHVRKVNPRIQLVDQERADLRPRRRRLFRRGIPYGPPLAKNALEDRQDRGLLFLAYQADLCRQFEHVVENWLDADFPTMNAPANGQAVARATGYDPIIGSPETGDIQYLKSRGGEGQEGGGDQVCPIKFDKVVELTAGAYLFAPALTQLDRLARPPDQ